MSDTQPSAAPPGETPDADPGVSLAAACGRALRARGLRLVVAESCTGGLVGHLLTEIPGSSAWFLGGVQAYADSVKTGLLGVPPALIIEHGAVSAACVLAMAAGARRALGGEVAIAVSGVAGPGGGTAAKPVGTVFIGLIGLGEPRVAQHLWAGNRTENKVASARAALALLLELLERG
jgi:PncC family amidohydrolase